MDGQVYGNFAPVPCAFESPDTSSHWTETSPVSESDGPPTVTKSWQCPWPGCDQTRRRSQEWEKHIFTFHLPDCFGCPHPTCRWRGHRKDKLNKHKTTCTPRPEWEEQYMIYDTKLAIQWILEGTPLILVEMFTLGFVEERAKELQKEKAWIDKWRCDKL